jgi:hypothetical protein
MQGQTTRSRRPFWLALAAISALTLSSLALPAAAKHGADDPPGDDRGGDDNNGADDNGGGNGGGSGGGGNAPRSRNGVFKFDQRNFQAREGSGAARIVVERSKGQRGAVSVTYTLVAGTAKPGQDYRAVSGTLSWAAGDGTNKVFEVPLLDDATAEGNERLQLVLSNPTGGAILDAVRKQAPLTILDDDGAARCAAGDLCLAAGRFAVTVATEGDTLNDASAASAGTIERIGAGAPEWLVRVEDFCATTGYYTVHVAEATTAAYRLRVVDTWNGLTKDYGRSPDASAIGADGRTFACR